LHADLPRDQGRFQTYLALARQGYFDAEAVSA
jgi:hypothetical protein